MASSSPSPSSSVSPYFDLFLDLPHPCASKSCPPCRLIWYREQQPPELSSGVNDLPSTISRFAFPEYTEDAGTAAPGANSNNSSAPSGAAAAARALRLNKHDLFAMQNVGFQSFTFTLQLQTGMRLHGHVRRYLPATPIIFNDSNKGKGGFCSRYDVGRRGERALVLLTRAGGADRLSDAVLKSIQAIQELQQQRPHFDKENSSSKQKDTVKDFLLALAAQQQQLAASYAGKPANEKGKPLLAAIGGLEFELDAYRRVDVHKFLVPTSLLQPKPGQLSSLAAGSDQKKQLQQQPDMMATCAILPVLRCIGIAHALRILSALLCERRVILVSSSPTRLTNCSHAVLAMLSCGLLQWQHLYIPVLPPHLWQYLAAPYPYLIGILAHMSNRLNQTDGLGEVLILNLDTNRMEARGFDTNVIPQKLPDLFAITDIPMQSPMANEVSPDAASASECLAQDLSELLKMDKRLMYGEASLTQNVGETAAKAAQSVKKTFFKLRDKGRQYLSQRSNSGSERDRDFNDGSSEMGMQESSGDLSAVNPLSPDFIYTEGCYNETCEAEARVAFAMFFLCMYGNMRWYLSASTAPGQVPQLDRQRFLQQKRSMGDVQGTPMWSLLQGFVQTQMLEEFAKARVEEVRTRQPVSPDAPLFAQCSQYHRLNNIDFGVISVRNVARQVWQSSASNPAHITGMVQTNARRNAMALTSNKYEGNDYNKAIAQLVEDCRESTSVLLDVMSVLWLRMRDSKGGQWKHGLQALQVMRSLLYHGPLAAVSEATDGLDKIRAMKNYENGMRPQSAQQIRGTAYLVYRLLVDRSQLFSIRRYCAHRRLELLQPTPKPAKDRRFTLTAPFRSLHNISSPTSGGTIVRMPSASAAPRWSDSGLSSGSASGGLPPQPPASEDLLGMAAASTPNSNADVFGLASPTTATTLQSNSTAANDMLGLFDSMSVSSATSGPPSQPSSSVHDIFGVAAPVTQPTPAAPAPAPPQVSPTTQTHPPQAAATPTPVASTSPSPATSNMPSTQTTPPPPQQHQQQVRQPPPHLQAVGQPSPQPPPPNVPLQPTYAKLPPAANAGQKQQAPHQQVTGQMHSYTPQQLPSHPYGSATNAPPPQQQRTQPQQQQPQQQPNPYMQQQQQQQQMQMPANQGRFDPFTQQPQQYPPQQQAHPGTVAPIPQQQGAAAAPLGRPQQPGYYQQQPQQPQQHSYPQQPGAYSPQQQPMPYQTNSAGAHQPQQQPPPPQQQQQQRINRQFDPFA